jgi:gamma-glutamylcyclotransferase (GGCT)/AIG2-like uncharacterized protein YtfP
MENNLTKIFVYGSLRSGFQNPAYEYISKYFNLVGEAKVKGRMYDLGSFPAAIPANDDSYIIGELYQHNNNCEFSWAIEQLDAYEGLSPEEGDVELYRRERVTAYYGANETTEAWIYWFNGSVDGHPIIASGDIFDFIHQKSKF